MEKLLIETPSSTYPVYIGAGIRRNSAGLLGSALAGASSVLIITDANVAPLYLEEVKASFSSYAKIHVHIVDAGEQAKSFESYYGCLTAALEAGLDRNSLIAALGGGVIGDLAGFTAATFMRGIRFVQIPTTLLAHDSAVGGKTGINHPAGKNLIGAFHQPIAVVYDVETFRTLPEREWLSGFAEVIKHSLIGSRSFYDHLRNQISDLEDLKSGGLASILKQAIAIKADVVRQDEKEQGVRAYLNFGHTLGHAVEAELGYGGMSHGEAVAIGMKYALSLSKTIRGMGTEADEAVRWIDSFPFPEFPKSLDAGKMIDRMKKDKKSTSGNINMVLLDEIAKPVKQPVSEDVLSDAINNLGEE
ncbi:3-dehydroquinate synthase [Bacillus marinisedimentorum]|uniref:3-dehydroquinate synthase n=1 Tax=Bacillus marinisedimentorum TaxID=1821260 RepID=UPI00087306A0|nr:3-dehydroquinate synthase [Bacillus marinisedimentorum]